VNDNLKKISIFAPAKVNLHLAVFNRRKDGFHDLESLFLALNFGDMLNFTIQEDREILCPLANIDIDMADVPLQENIIYKAVKLFQDKTGFAGLKIEVDKRIPLGGGLGGGSSDAAATLLAINKLAGSPLKREELLEMAVVLGSDVPFFLYETPAARVSGRGEIIEPVDLPQMFLVLVNPGFPSDTGRAFSLLDSHRKDTSRTAADPHILTALEWSKFKNDFLDVFTEKERAVYNEIISELRELGAFYANLSGSGATCFGVFEKEEQAKKAAGVLQDKWDFVTAAHSFLK